MVGGMSSVLEREDCLRGDAMEVPVKVFVESEPVFQMDLILVPGANL
jgi:hypothetical protein